MAKQATRVDVKAFVKGIITEASPLNFPDNASIDDENFNLNRDGTRTRRLGMQYENNWGRVPLLLNGTTALDAAYSTFKWLAVNGDPEKQFLAVQAGNVVCFLDLNNPAPSQAYLGAVTLSSFPSTTKFSFTSTEGKLIIVAGQDTIALVEYKNFNFVQSYVRLLVRDMWGIQTIDQGYENDLAYRSNVFDVNHVYNLRNQSWGTVRRNSKDSAPTLYDPVKLYLEETGLYPSNSEQVWTGLTYQAGNTAANPPVAPFEAIYANLFKERFAASLKAPKGAFIIDALSRGISRAQAYDTNTARNPNLDTRVPVFRGDVTTGGARIAAEYAGRIFYAGFDGEVIDGDTHSPNLTNYVMFSQLVRNTQDINRCYQEGDPTSRESSDIVDTDGGFLRVSGAKKIIALVNIDSNLIVLADNGVWAISGGSDYGFTATNYKVVKISNFGCLTQSSVVTEGQRLYFWSVDGIYTVAKDQFGSLQVTNITQTTIQKLYDEIPSFAKERVVGTYDMYEKKVRWLYKVNNLFSSESITYELILDTTLSAFYKYRINAAPGANAEVMSLFSSETFARIYTNDSVYANTELVQAGSDFVEVQIIQRTSGTQATRYLVLERNADSITFTIGYYRNTQFLDWSDISLGVDAKAYVLGGYVVGGDAAIAKQMPYIVMYFNRTEKYVDENWVPLNQSGCFMRCQWDWTNSIVSNKWSKTVQVYRYNRPRFTESVTDTFDTGHEVITTKSKVRGRGKAFSIYLETEPLKDCQLVGWSMAVNGNTIT